MKPREVDELYDRIKIFPGHRVKFQSMLDLMKEELLTILLRGRSNTAIADVRSISPPSTKSISKRTRQRNRSIEAMDEFVFP
jgi:transposase-like protein